MLLHFYYFLPILSVSPSNEAEKLSKLLRRSRVRRRDSSRRQKKRNLRVSSDLFDITRKAHRSLLRISRFCSGIADACVVDGLQFVAKYSLGVSDVAEGDGTFLEVTIRHHAVDKSVYKLAYRLFCVVGQ